MNKRPAPRSADHIRADDDIAELARYTRGEVVAAIDRKRERIRRLVDAEILPLQRADLLGADECQSELAFVDPLAGQHLARERDRSFELGLCAAAVDDLDVDHRAYFFRCVP